MEPSRKRQKKEPNNPPRRSARTNKSPTPEPEKTDNNGGSFGLPRAVELPSGPLITTMSDKKIDALKSYFTSATNSKSLPAALGSASPSPSIGGAGNDTAAAPSVSGLKRAAPPPVNTYVSKFGSGSNVMQQLIQEKFRLNCQLQQPIKLGVDEKTASDEEKTEEAEKVEDVNAGCLLFQLPAELVSHIFEKYMTYDDVSKVRGVSRWFRNTCGEHLNRAFSRLQSKMQGRFQAIKSQMPRRESARRKHPLARECDIIETVHMRLTLLQMTFGRHIDRRHCCFFPGAIIDEVYRILEYIKATANLGRAYKVTDELFDLSTMAMEYFKDKVEPTLPEVNYFTTAEFPELANPFKSSLSCAPPILQTPTTDKTSAQQTPKTPATAPTGNHGNQDKQTQLKRQVRHLRCDVGRMKREVTRYRSRTMRLQKQNMDYNLRLVHMERKEEERERKLNVALEELRKLQTEVCGMKQIMQSQVSPPVVEN